MFVEVEVIKMITTGVILKMSQEECNQLMTDLEKINLYREEASECALDIIKNVADHFVKDGFLIVGHNLYQWSKDQAEECINHRNIWKPSA